MEKSTFEKCESVQRVLLTAAGEALSYGWLDDFKIKNMQDAVKRIIEHQGKIDPTDLTFHQMDELGFGRWEESNPMRLIPLWLHPFLVDKFTSVSISGSVHEELSGIDTDHRAGYLAYGVTPNYLKS